MEKDLVAFFEKARNRTGPKNIWLQLHVNGIALRVYVRTFQDQAQLASVTLNDLAMRGRGTFRAFLPVWENVAARYAASSVVECVQNRRFAIFLQQAGYVPKDATLPPTLVKPLQQKDKL